MKRVLRAARRLARRALGRTRDAGSLHRAAYDEVVGRIGVPVTDVVVISRGRGLGLAAALAAPGRTVHLLTVTRLPAEDRARLPAGVRHRRCATVDARVDHLRTLPQPQLVVEHGLDPAESADTFRAIFGAIADGGAYLSPHVGSAASSEPITLAIAGTETLPAGLLVRKQHTYRWMLRDARATRVLTKRYGDAWGELLATKPATTYPSRAEPETVGEGLRRLKPVIKVPERHLRRYADVTCLPRKRLRLGDFWLPDTFRNPRMRTLGHRALESLGPDLARATGPDPVVREAAGPCFSLDSEYPAHFGHVLTDVVSNVWGWSSVRERVPGVRPLVSLPAGAKRMPEFQRQIFAALDVAVDDVEYVRPGEAVHVAELYACTADWALPGYAAPELADVWGRIRDRCAAAPDPSRPRRLFVTRAPRAVRTCRNAAEVEEFFADLCFAVVRPETLPFAEQVALFAGAEVIAGFAGSAMFGAMFAPAATRVVVITGASFTALNDYLIKSVVGGPVAYVWTPSDLQHPATGWTWEAYRSNFVVDLDRFGPDLARLVA